MGVKHLDHRLKSATLPIELTRLAAQCNVIQNHIHIQDRHTEASKTTFLINIKGVFIHKTQSS